MRTVANDRKPRLDHLFALKRAERPDAAYWREFEERLRQRQLAALIEPAPWWYGALLFLRRISVQKAVVPVVAISSIALIFTLRISNLNDVGVIGTPVSSTSEHGFLTNSAPRLASSPDAQSYSLSGSMAGKLDRVAGVETSASDSADAVAKAIFHSEVFSEGIDRLSVKQGTALVQSGLTSMPRTSADSLAQADTPSTSPVLIGLGKAMSVNENASSLDAGAAGVAVSTTNPEAVESLASVNFDAAWQEGIAALPSVNAAQLTPRQARLLAAVDGSAGASLSKSLAHVRDRVVHSLEASDELYASASRVGVSGDRLSLKF